VAPIGKQIATGLHYAHERRIVHRDIKPANLFYTNEGAVKIMDFGLAKMIEEVRRSTTVLGGTPYYMAPEQSSGGAISTATDIYSFGVTLFELATGRVPFKQGDVAHEHRHTPAPDPRELVPELPAPLAELILCMLAKDPESRPDALTVGENL
jgi:serine/threonine-protein kinase